MPATPTRGPIGCRISPSSKATQTLLGDSLALRYLVDTAVANAAYPLTIDFYVADASEREGRNYLGSDTYLEAEAQNQKLANIPAPASLTSTLVVATATDADGNTSEFSLPIEIVTPVNLGSEPTVILENEEIESGEVDYYQYTAHETGKLIIHSHFIHVAGDLDLEVRDEFGNVIEIAADSSPGQDFEEIVIPVVSQETYFIGVSGLNLPPGEPEEQESQIYDLEIENFPTPVPTGVHLDPASDTGMLNNDNVTFDTTPTLFIQTDVLNFVDENRDGLFNVGEILPLTAAQAEANDTPGIAVQLTLVNTTTGTSDTFFADPLVALVPEVYTFTPDEPLEAGVYFITARTKIFDGRGTPEGDPDPAMDRSNASHPLWMTIDPGDAQVGSIDLLSSSDTGMLNNDNVTAKWEPAFTGTGPANAKVHITAIESDADGALIGDLLLVGSGVVGSDLTDGVPDNGQGRWEVTVEPMDEGKWNFFARFESAAGILSDPVGVTATTVVIVDEAIPDEGTVTSTTTIDQASFAELVGDAADMNVPVIDVNVTINIEHEFSEDLVITLIAPDGTEVLLSSDNGSASDFTNTVFDDSAASAIIDGESPFTGVFRPEEPLSNVNGINAFGDWQLRVEDNQFDGTGTLLNWTLQIVTPLMVVIDKTEPNTPFLDLITDTGRHDEDNLTKNNTPLVTMTSTDPNIELAQLLFQDNLKFPHLRSVREHGRILAV